MWLCTLRRFVLRPNTTMQWTAAPIRTWVDGLVGVVAVTTLPSATAELKLGVRAKVVLVKVDQRLQKDGGVRKYHHKEAGESQCVSSSALAQCSHSLTRPPATLPPSTPLTPNPHATHPRAHLVFVKDTLDLGDDPLPRALPEAAVTRVHVGNQLGGRIKRALALASRGGVEG